MHIRDKDDCTNSRQYGHALNTELNCPNPSISSVENTSSVGTWYDKSNTVEISASKSSASAAARISNRKLTEIRNVASPPESRLITASCDDFADGSSGTLAGSRRVRQFASRSRTSSIWTAAIILAKSIISEVVGPLHRIYATCITVSTTDSESVGSSIFFRTARNRN